MEEMYEHGGKDMVIMLVGNKVDLEKNRQISYEEGARFAKQNNLIFMETSAKTGKNVENVFYTSAKLIWDNIEKSQYDLSNEHLGIKPGNKPKSKNLQAQP
jgi:Ras-related protein Rab-2A